MQLPYSSLKTGDKNKHAIFSNKSSWEEVIEPQDKRHTLSYPYVPEYNVHPFLCHTRGISYAEDEDFSCSIR